MAASQLISDYVGRGPLAGRPASPTVSAGGSAIYFDTGASALYVWDGSAWQQITGGAPAPTLVQSKVNGGTINGLTLSAAPTLGNLLLAGISSSVLTDDHGTGWTFLGASPTASPIVWYFKVAGASESATQTPVTTATTTSLAIFELSGCTVCGLSGLGNFAATASVSMTMSAPHPSGIIVGVHSIPISSTVTISGATIVAQATFGARTVTAFAITSPSAANAITSTYSGGGTSTQRMGAALAG